MYCICCENLRCVDRALKRPFQGWLSAIDPVKEIDIAVAWLGSTESKVQVRKPPHCPEKEGRRKKKTLAQTYQSAGDIGAGSHPLTRILSPQHCVRVCVCKMPRVCAECCILVLPTVLELAPGQLWQYCLERQVECTHTHLDTWGDGNAINLSARLKWA